MAYELTLDALNSRITRDALLSKSDDKRTVEGIQVGQKGEGNALDFTLSIFSGLTGFISRVALNLLSFASFSFSAIWGLIVQTSVSIYNYNFNATDTDLDTQVKSQWVGFASQLGGLVGSNIGYILCGFVPTAITFVFNPILAAAIVKELGEEFLDEIAGQTANVIRGAVYSVAVSGFNYAYKNARKALKQPYSPLNSIVGREKLNQWGEPGGQPWSFAIAVENFVETIPNPFVRSFTENLLEETWDACVDAGFLVSSIADTQLAASRLSNAYTLGEDKTVEIYPDRENTDNYIVLQGKEKVLAPILVETVNQQIQLEKKDVGNFVGESFEDYISPKPTSVRLHIVCYSKKAPPYNFGKDSMVRRSTITVSDVPQANLDYDKIRKAVGGVSGYLWGRYLAVAQMDNTRKVLAWGGSRDEAEKRVREIAELSSASIQTINVTEELPEDNRDKEPTLKKPTTQVYAAYATITVQNKTLKGGRAANDGIKRQRITYRFDIWRTEKPIDFNEQVASLFVVADN
jgi:hypothetical protein